MACPPTAKYVREFMPNGYQVMQPPQNYASAAYLPRRLEQTAPSEPGGLKRAVSGTGSVGGSNRIAVAQPGTATTGNLIFSDRGVFARKQEQMPPSQLQPAVATNQPERQISAKQQLLSQPQVVQAAGIQQHYATSGQQPQVLKLKRPASRDPNYNQPLSRGSASGQALPGLMPEKLPMIG